MIKSKKAGTRSSGSVKPTSKKIAAQKSASKKRRRTAADTANIEILAWENDPFAQATPSPNPPAGNPIIAPAPDMTKTALSITIRTNTPPPVPAKYNLGTPEFRYWTAAEALRRGADFWSSILPAGTTWFSSVGPTLQVYLDLGEDLNAYYTRQRLEFYHASVGGGTVYSGESPDILLHELGHAILDSIRPQLFQANYIEAAAFHEAFGDISAMLCGLQLGSLRDRVLFETQGNLYRTSRLSRLAEQLGWAIRQRQSDAVDPDCLRNAVNSFFYQDPAKLPPKGPASILTSQPHSFSRVFAGAFLEALAGMLEVSGAATSVNLLKVSRDAGRLLVQGILNAPVVPDYYSQVAAAMVHADNGPYRTALTSAFVRHGVLSLEAAATTGSGSRSARRLSGRTVALTDADAEETQLVTISCAEYGFGFESMQVFAPSEGHRYPAASADVDLGSVQSPGPEEAAKYFVEDLLKRGRIEITPAASPGKGAHPFSHLFSKKTHILAKRGRSIVLERLRFDCGFDNK